MRIIANQYMEQIADVKSVPEKYTLLKRLYEVIGEFEIRNGMKFMKFTYSRTNPKSEVEIYEMIFFSDMFSLLVKKVYTPEGELCDCAIMEYYDEDFEMGE